MKKKEQYTSISLLIERDRKKKTDFKFYRTHTIQQKNNNKKKKKKKKTRKRKPLTVSLQLGKYFSNHSVPTN